MIAAPIPPKWNLFAILAFLLLSLNDLLPGTALAADTAVEGSPPSNSAAALRLLFSSLSDARDSWGHLHVGVTPVRLIKECEPSGFNFIAGFPLPDGRWQVFGQQMTEIKPGTEPFDRITEWKLVRGTTRDGITFDDVETVHGPVQGTWTDHTAMAFNPERREYLFLKLLTDNSGIAYHAFFSPDGKTWTEHPQSLFYDGDAMSLFWSPPLKRFVCVSKSLQPYRKHIIDHGGPTPSLKDDSLRDRRVLVFRMSVDGRTWEPDVSLVDVWNRNKRKAQVPDQFMTTPDELDPPDLEFYSGNGFWYRDRAYLMSLDYAASAATPRKHAHHIDNEWWTSRDGLHWERPARGINVLEEPRIPRIECPPMLIGGQILFRYGHLLLGLPEDRITALAARANAEFSTEPFTMPDADLVLNASVPSPDRPFAKEGAYVMAALLDESGQIIPGYEADKCLLQKVDGIDLPLRWGENSAKALVGKKVQIRLFLRSATVYAVTGRSVASETAPE